METEDKRASSVEQAVERVLGLEQELEVSGTSATGGEALAFGRAALHAWVDTVVAVVAVPGSGRVTLIHANGARSAINSPQLPYQVTPPVKF